METIIDVEFCEDLIMENTRLRMLVKELADELDMVKPKMCVGCPAALCSIAGEPCGAVKYANTLVARAKEEVKDGE